MQTSKTCANSLWGKFAQNGNLGSTTFFNDPSKFYEVIGSDETLIKGIHIVNENIVLLQHQKEGMFQEELPNTNVAVAAYVTSYARLELYSHMEHLKERLVYCDTDSVIFYSPLKVGDESLPVGDALGDLTDELRPGEHITEFVSGGPKNYGYRTNMGKEKMTVKGITLNARTSDVVTFDLLKEIVLQEGRSSVHVVEPNHFFRDIRTRAIYTAPLAKIFRKVYTKRRLLEDGVSTKPFGYVD